MRRTTFSVAASILVAVVIAVCWPGNLEAQDENRAKNNFDPFAPPAEEARGTKPSKDTSLEEKLNKPATMEFVESPLKDVVSYLQEQTQIPFVLNAKKLEEAGVSVDTPVTKNLRGVRLSTTLDLMLGELDLAYVEKDGLIIITTPEDAESQLETRVYDCRDLLGMPAQSWPKGSRAADEKGRESSAPEPVGGYGEGAGFGGGSRRREYDERAARLMNIITTNVHSWSWQRDKDPGGPGAISDFNGLFVITQTQPTHKEIERLLDMLRTAAGLEVGARKVVR